MNKVVLIQCPKKFIEVVPIFCKECLKYDIFDKIYVATPCKIELEDKCELILLPKDRQFSSNIIYAMKCIPEDLFLLSCEDHIMVGENKKEDFENTFRFMLDNPNAGSLRLTYHNKIKFRNHRKNRFIEELHPSYKYQVAFQQSWVQKSYLSSVLTLGEDAWVAERNASRKANRTQKTKYCVTRPVSLVVNFYCRGQYLRHEFVDYAMNHGINIGKKFPVLVAIKDNHKIISGVISVDQYMSAVYKNDLLETIKANRSDRRPWKSNI